ncbi:hypothetical protein F2P81_021901 [Scophthalmus maximus]|uniref:DNA-directed RNA polymerase III subunit RPC4-like n=1 Tax=Scophthalmus maximus TaxID=52904 RepID=A0A6A4S067_SCOMX|nr:hypothetical protein F2P81_021901 [Scophthalmus maximus]
MLVANASSVQQHTSSFSPKRDTKPRQKRHYFKLYLSYSPTFPAVNVKLSSSVDIICPEKCYRYRSSEGPEKPPSRPLVCAAQDRVGRTEVPKPEEPSLVNLLQDLSLSGEEELFFMQLPDCMPGRASEQKVMAPTVRSTSEKLAKNDSRPEDKRPAHLQAQQAVMKEGCPVLSQLPEGFLGKLQIRKSGKVELKLGDIVMDISEGAAFSFLQQLVSVRLSDGKTGDMMVLGNVHHKLVLSPDFHTLLRQASTEQQKETR